MKLTKKQEAFAEHYAIHGNATEAYRSAGYLTKGKPERAHEEACKLAQHPKVAPRIVELQQKVRKQAEEKFDLTYETITQAYMDIAFCDPADFMTWDKDGNITLRPPEELSPRQRRIIAHIQKSSGHSGTIDVKRCDRVKALDALARSIGYFAADNAQTKPTINVVTDAAADFDARMEGLLQRAMTIEETQH